MGKINSPFRSAILILLSLYLVVSCYRPQIQNTQAMGVYHLVKKNETVQMIAQAYNIRLQDLVEINNITDINSVKEGSVIFIPAANQVIDDVMANVKTKNTAANVKAQKYNSDNVNDIVKNKDVKEVKTMTEAPAVAYKKDALPAVQDLKTQQSKIAVREETAQAVTIPGEEIPDEKIEPRSRIQKPGEKIFIDKNRFIWPVRGSVKDKFGIQPNKTYHNWIKIVSTAGTKVKAAASGTIIFSSHLKNYGETIIIRHKDKFATVYTHLKKRYVRIDQDVKRAETIAILGETDDVGLAYINFEVRLQGKARNPLFFLP
ncbi:MAG: peptidoglycan DD-metalloendopeptidase family protein [Smithella sp.]